MVVKTLFSEDDFRAILSLYNLGEYRDATPFAGGTVQTNYLLTTASAKCVLKYYENRTVESVRFEANLIHYIRRRDFPCAAIRKNKKGQAVGLYNRKPYVIFEHIEGQAVDEPTPQQRHQIVRAAATLQVITQRYTPHWKHFRWNYSRELCFQLVQERAGKLGTDNAQAKLLWFEQALTNLNLPNSLPKGICHCDYDLSNILFNAKEFVALIVPITSIWYLTL